MALWNIHRIAAGTLKLTYRASSNAAPFACGDVAHDTPGHLLLEWIVTVGEPSPGDLIVCPDRTVLHLTLKRGKA